MQVNFDWKLAKSNRRNKKHSILLVAEFPFDAIFVFEGDGYFSTIWRLIPAGSL